MYNFRTATVKILKISWENVLIFDMWMDSLWEV